MTDRFELLAGALDHEITYADRIYWRKIFYVYLRRAFESGLYDTKRETCRNRAGSAELERIIHALCDDRAAARAARRSATEDGP